MTVPLKQNTKPLAKTWIIKLVYEGQVINLALTSLTFYYQSENLQQIFTVENWQLYHTKALPGELSTVRQTVLQELDYTETTQSEDLYLGVLFFSCFDLPKTLDKNQWLNQTWWHITVTAVLGRLRQGTALSLRPTLATESQNVYDNIWIFRIKSMKCNGKKKPIFTLQCSGQERSLVNIRRESDLSSSMNREEGRNPEDHPYLKCYFSLECSRCDPTQYEKKLL